MRFEDIAAAIGELPHISTKQGRELYDFVLSNDIHQVLELGFAHGVSACYMGAALHEKGEGTVTTLDLHAALDRTPNIFKLLEITGLKEHVTPVFCDTSYTWNLKQMIEQQTRDKECVPLFDFCFIDGAHNWDVDGFAFFLVDKLLKPGGWLLLDDLDWSYHKSPMLKDKDWVKKLPKDQRKARQIESVFDLLVSQHPSYEGQRRTSDWGWARKGPSGTSRRKRRGIRRPFAR